MEQFQSLIGSLKIRPQGLRLDELDKFQSLIGSLKIGGTRSHEPGHIRFNPS